MKNITFKQLEPSGSSYGFGCIPSPYDARDYTLTASKDVELPAQFCLKPLKIKDQGQQGTCVAHALSEAVEFHYHKDTEEYHEFSTEFIYGMRNILNDSEYTGEGMFVRDGLKIINKYGDVFVEQMPGNHNATTATKNVRAKLEELKSSAAENKITTYYRVVSIEEVKRALYTTGPVVMGMLWPGDAKLVNNVYTYTSSKRASGHAVLIIGYDEVGFIVQNSWGDYWGDNGTFKLKYEDFEELAFDTYGITDDEKAIKKPYNKLSLVARLINIGVNFIRRYFRKN